jgi:hypothetical protein
MDWVVLRDQLAKELLDDGTWKVLFMEVLHDHVARPKKMLIPVKPCRYSHICESSSAHKDLPSDFLSEKCKFFCDEIMDFDIDEKIGFLKCRLSPAERAGASRLNDPSHYTFLSEQKDGE